MIPENEYKKAKLEGLYVALKVLNEVAEEEEEFAKVFDMEYPSESAVIIARLQGTVSAKIEEIKRTIT